MKTLDIIMKMVYCNTNT